MNSFLDLIFIVFQKFIILNPFIFFKVIIFTIFFFYFLKNFKKYFINFLDLLEVEKSKVTETLSKPTKKLKRIRSFLKSKKDFLLFNLIIPDLNCFSVSFCFSSLYFF